MGLTIAAYTVQATLRMRAEEASGRAEPLLATRVGRIRWAMSHLVFAVLGTAGRLLALTGASPAAWPTAGRSTTSVIRWPG